MMKPLFTVFARDIILKIFPIEQSIYTANAGDSSSGLGVETIPA